MASPRISVLLAAYNSERFVEEAVESVLAQSFEDFELLAVDDGSTDNTKALLNGFSDRRVRVISQENRGVSSTRNRGLEEARGSIVTFLDADDLWPPDRLLMDAELMQSGEGVDVAFGNFLRFDEDGTYPDDQFTFHPELETVSTRPVGLGSRIIEDPAFETIVGWQVIPGWHSAVTYRRAWIGNRRFSPQLRGPGGRLTFLEDLHFFMTMAHGAVVGYHQGISALIRRHGGNVSSDWRGLEIANLGSLNRLRELELSQSEREALDVRIARQHVRVASYLAGEREPLAALAHLRETAALGHSRFAAKGLARATLNFLRS